MQRMSPMIRDVSRYPDPAVWSEGGGQLAVLDHQDCCDDWADNSGDADL